MLRVGRFVCGENCFSQSRRFQKELWTILVKKREKTLVVVLNNLMLSKQQQKNVESQNARYASRKCALDAERSQIFSESGKKTLEP